MDDNCKKKLAEARKLLQEQKFAEAQELLEIMSYKYSKVYQVVLMLALSYTKLNQLDKAQKEYLNVLDLVPNQPNSLKQLCEIYSKRGNLQQGTKYMQLNVDILKKTDLKKYREAIPKLVDLYQKDLNMQKIQKLFFSYCENEETVGEDFAYLAWAYFKVATTNQCFFLQKFQVMGVRGQQIRRIIPAAKESMNRLLIEIVDYMRAVASSYQVTKQDMANSIMELNMYFPDCTSVLMLLLFDEYCVGQMTYSSHILGQLYMLFQAHFDQVENSYHNMRFTSPEVFSVCMQLAKEYLSFFKEFFTLDQAFEKYYPQLASIQGQLQGVAIREQYRKKIDRFILKECRELNEQSKHLNIERKLQNMKQRIELLQNSYLQEVIAKIALHSFSSYNQLNDMKYKLKVRIKNLDKEVSSPHLYKYYYDYVMKMARIYKSLDEEIPIKDVLQYITTHDPSDFKYRLQYIWFNFSMTVKSAAQDSKQQLAKEAISAIRQILDKFEGKTKSEAYRKLAVLKIVAGQTNIEEQVNSALNVQRSFQNLQCAAFFYFHEQKVLQALILACEAYRLYKGHYHANRLFFLTLYLRGNYKEAIAFLQDMHPNFIALFWVNYFLGVNKINQKQFLLAEKYMNKALQAYQAGSQDSFRFGYEKVYDIGPFSLMHLIQQNEYCIFYDQIVFPEEYIYKILPALSNLYFQREVHSNRINLYLKEGQLLKILGRTKSSLNYLEDAYSQSAHIPVSPQSDPKVILQHALLRKEYSTLLFYSSRERQAGQMLLETNTLVQWLLNVEESFLALKLDNQVQALFFEISISRLTTMMHFESYQSISDYLKYFQTYITVPKYPSLSFLKNKYQYHILHFMHTRDRLDEVQNSVATFLKHFDLDFTYRLQQRFIYKYLQLDQSQRKFVRQCIQDYYIVRGLSNPADQNELLQMMSIFPRSSTLCVLFGCATKDLKLQTASFLKVIQLDKESSISMDILASLYLKQKNYLAAAKLFLKSLEKDVLSTKCYLGLAICLFCLILRAVELRQKDQVDIVRQCLVRINSYMQFIRINDPSEQYHILDFLKLLLNDQASTHFQNKFVLQSVRTQSATYKGTLIEQLYKIANLHTQTSNFWKNEHQISIVESYLSTAVKEINKEHKPTVMLLLDKAEKALKYLQSAKGSIGGEIGLKYFQKLLHEIAIIINMAIKIQKFDLSIIQELHSLLKKWETEFRKWGFKDSELAETKKKIKAYIHELILLGEWNSGLIQQTNIIFSNVFSYNYLVSHNHKIPNLHKEINKNLFMNPHNEEIRKIHSGYLVVNKGWSARKAKLSYRLEILSNNNINTSEDSHTYKQIAFLYQDPTALLLYIQRQWNISGARSEQNVKKWVTMTEYIKNKLKDKAQGREKAQRLKLQMLAFLQTQFKVQMKLMLDQYEKNKLSKLTTVYRIMQNIAQKQSIKKELKQLSALFVSKVDDFDWWILLSLITYLVRRVELPQNFDQVIELLEQKAPQASYKVFTILFKFLLTIRRDPKTEAQLVNQIIQLSKLCESCQNHVSPTTQVILQCTRCLLLSSWDDMQVQLSRIAETKVSSYSDIILINFFEVLKQYKTAEGNPNGQGVVQMLVFLVDSFLTIIKEPQLQGMILSLKGIILGIGHEGLPRQMKLAMLYSPPSAKRLLRK